VRAFENSSTSRSLWILCCLCTYTISDCNPRIKFSIPGSRIKKFGIPRSSLGIWLTRWSLL